MEWCVEGCSQDHQWHVKTISVFIHSALHISGLFHAHIFYRFYSQMVIEPYSVPEPSWSTQVCGDQCASDYVLWHDGLSRSRDDSGAIYKLYKCQKRARRTWKCQNAKPLHSQFGHASGSWLREVVMTKPWIFGVWAFCSTRWWSSTQNCVQKWNLAAKSLACLASNLLETLRWVDHHFRAQTTQCSSTGACNCCSLDAQIKLVQLSLLWVEPSVHREGSWRSPSFSRLFPRCLRACKRWWRTHCRVSCKTVWFSGID